MRLVAVELIGSVIALNVGVDLKIADVLRAELRDQAVLLQIRGARGDGVEGVGGKGVKHPVGVVQNIVERAKLQHARGIAARDHAAVLHAVGIAVHLVIVAERGENAVCKGVGERVAEAVRRAALFQLRHIAAVRLRDHVDVVRAVPVVRAGLNRPGGAAEGAADLHVGVVRDIARALDGVAVGQVVDIGGRDEGANRRKADSRRRDRAEKDQALENACKALEQNDMGNQKRRAAAEQEAEQKARERREEHFQRTEDRAHQHARDKGHEHLHRVAGQPEGKARLSALGFSASQQHHAQHEAARGEQQPVDDIRAVICRQRVERLEQKALRRDDRRHAAEERLRHAADELRREGIAEADRQKAEHGVDGAAAADRHQAVKRDTGDRAEWDLQKEPQDRAVHFSAAAEGDQADDAEKEQRGNHRRRECRCRLAEEQHARLDGQRIDPIRLALVVQIGKHAQGIDDRKDTGQDKDRRGSRRLKDVDGCGKRLCCRVGALKAHPLGVRRHQRQREDGSCEKARDHRKDNQRGAALFELIAEHRQPLPQIMLN